MPGFALGVIVENTVIVCCPVRLVGAVAVRSGGTVVADVGSVSVVNAVGVVVGLVVGPAPASADRINRDGDDEEQHGADDSGHVECDADAGVMEQARQRRGLPQQSSVMMENTREHTAIPEWSSSGGDW